MNYKYYIKFWLLRNKKKLVTAEYESIYSIKDRSIKDSLVFLDIDDTLSGNVDTIPKRSIKWLKSLQKESNRIILISNSNRQRERELKNIFKEIASNIITRSSKPSPKPFLEEIRKSKDFKSMYMIGDRIATDLYGAYLAGIENRYLVKPYSDLFRSQKASLIYRIIRAIENCISKYT